MRTVQLRTHLSMPCTVPAQAVIYGSRLLKAEILRSFYRERQTWSRSVRELQRQREVERLYAEGYYDHIIGW